MARQRRIEYEGAIYHVMARGDRREAIVHDDRDRQRFEDTFAEVVESCGWVVYAWVLMSNHYHGLFQTPEPNLVAGIIRKWALVDNGWLAERLHMGARNAVSRTIGMARRHVERDRQARGMAKLVEQNVK